MQLCIVILISILLSACASKHKAPPANIAQLTAEAALNDQAREMAKREQLQKKLEGFPKDALAQRVDLAQRQATKARGFFKNENFRKALGAYAKAVEYDPFNDQYFYEYGLTLYKMNLFAKAIAVLNTLESTDVNQTELNYYQGLCYYKLKSDDAALAKFKHTEEAEDPVLSPLAAMYAGLIDKYHERFDDAKKHFDYILEKSQDADLDKRAEEQVDDLIHQQQFIERGKQKWAYSYYFGTGYDSNVLNAAAVNAVYNMAAYRALYGGAVSYKAVYDRKNSLIPQIGLSDMYSLDKKFKADDLVQSADPFQAEISLPYKHYFHDGTLTVMPSHQILVMSLGGGNRDLVYDSMSVATTYTISYAEDWLTNYRVDFGRDLFHIKETQPDDDQTANKITLLLSQTNVLADDGSKSWTLDFLYSKSDTKGDNFRYNKFLVGLGGNFPLSRSRRLVGYARGDYFTMTFPDNPQSRSDTGLIFSAGGGYALGEKSALGLNLQYYKNGSSVAAYDYDKYVVNLVYSFNSGFF